MCSFKLFSRESDTDRRTCPTMKIFFFGLILIVSVSGQRVIPWSHRRPLSTPECKTTVYSGKNIRDEPGQKDCIPRQYDRSSVVCVCNSTYCDTIPRPEPLPTGQYLTYTSSESGLRFKKEQGVFQVPSGITVTTITIDRAVEYQNIIGWGGAFTDATGINIKSLSLSAQANLLKSYFTEDGLEYNLCRVPIGGTDFSTKGYSYNDGDPDPDLINFKLAPEDLEYKIPLIKEAQQLMGGNLELFASAWTAPKWMKHNGEYTGPDSLKDEMYQSWANYFLKFLQEYKKEGITFWGITTGNEPSTGLIPSKINSVGWVPKNMGKFVAENLGPTLRNSEFTSIKLMTVDDQAFFFPLYIDRMFLNDQVSQYIDGFALHWYWNNIIPHSVLSTTHDKYPDKFILATEACEGSQLFAKAVLLGEWGRAETYAYDIIQDLNNWVTGWIDWNMALDETGGPTYIDNNVDSTVIVNASAGEFYKQPIYYALGHFSKFIPKGSARVSTTVSTSNIETTVFKRPDNGMVLVLLNRNSNNEPVRIRESTNNNQVIEKMLAPKSITTIMYW